MKNILVFVALKEAVKASKLHQESMELEDKTTEIWPEVRFTVTSYSSRETHHCAITGKGTQNLEMIKI